MIRPVEHGPEAVRPSSIAGRVGAAGLVLLALLVAPAPLLPPHRFAEAVQSILGVGWKAAYLAAAVGLQSAFYGSLGLVAVFALRRSPTRGGRLLQLALMPWAVVAVSLIVRAVKAGHLPVWTNAMVPVVACLAGAGFGLGLRYRRGKEALAIAVVVVGTALWGLAGGPSSALSRDTAMHLRRLVAAGPLPSPGETRFAYLVEAVFAHPPNDAGSATPVEHNRAAILALGIAIGDGRLARLVGLEGDTALVRQAMAAGTGAALRGRGDWAKHYTVSAALAVLEHPLVSDAAGLMKEQLDALTQGSGFSFGDLAADRAGVRFAAAATHSTTAAEAMQARLRDGFAVDEFFPPAADLPEDLTVEQFRRDYGRVGSPRYRQVTADIEARLDRCPGLSPPPHGEAR
ncbi:MAG: hypothetical protein OEW17_07930 [Gemmatimonadota bacterium]|nr:hypothetical protein [Gemmatimonadota bacterium]MDH4348719.1 hypothetical protein [Gemmatimonadota bacterium]MDH5284099.1 hypothetical protein [Gemmatimonadota bacterium]